MQRGDEMSNKMKNIFIVLFIVLLAFNLEAFEPQTSDFENSYQFNMYQSWLEKGSFKPNFPGDFSVKKIVKYYETEERTIVTEFDWENWKIYQQRELIPAADKLKTSFPKSAEMLESFIYRLNCAKPEFIKDFTSNSKIKLPDCNIVQLWEKYKSERVTVDSLQYGKQNGSIHLTLFINQKKLQLLLPTNGIDISELREFEQVAESPKSKFSDEVAIWDYSVTSPKAKPKNLLDFIRINKDISQMRELLHNKIDNVDDFLQGEFPNSTYEQDETISYIDSGMFNDIFHSSIFTQFKKSEDGTDIYPLNDYQIEGNNIQLPSGESIPTSGLNQQDMNIMGERLPHLVYEHRALGSKLLNFLLIHADVPTTLVLNGAEREIFDLPSYANLLLIISEYWQDYKVYFNMDEVTRVDGYIEMKGTLLGIPQNESKGDMAEVRFHLNKEFKLDLIMISLYIDVESQ